MSGADDENVGTKEQVQQPSLHPSQTMSVSHRIGLIVMGCVQIMLAGGIVFGWASVEGHNSLITSSPSLGGAGLTVEQATKVYGLSASTAYLGTLPIGWILDRFGPRACCIVMHSFVVVGAHLFTHYDASSSSSSSSSVPWITAAMVCLSMGYGMLSSVVHVANLFPKHYNFIMSAMDGCIAFNFALLTLFEYIWEQSDGRITIHGIFGVYRNVIAVSLVASFFLWPDEPYPQLSVVLEGDKKSQVMSPDAQHEKQEQQQPNDEDDIETLDTSRAPLLHSSNDTTSYDTVSNTTTTGANREANRMEETKGTESSSAQGVASEKTRSSSTVTTLQTKTKKNGTLWEQAKSGTYIRTLIVFLTCSYTANWVVAAFPLELAHYYSHNTINNDDDGFAAVSLEDLHLAQKLTLFFSFGVPASFWMGFALDRYGLIVCTTLTIIMGILYPLLTILLFSIGRNGMSNSSNGSSGMGDDDIDADERQRQQLLLWITIISSTSFVVYTCFRQWLFPVFISSLSLRLGFDHFGTLFGIGFALSGLVQMVGIAPVVAWIDSTCAPTTAWMVAHIIQAFLFGILLVIPWMDFTLQRKELYHADFPRGSAE